MNWQRCALAVLDIETTGLRAGADWTVEIAVVHIDDQRLGATQSWLVRPAMPIPPEATAIHGIDDAAVAGSPGLADIGPEVIAMLVGRVPVGYNAATFDRAFLAADWIRAAPYDAMPAQLHPDARWLDVLTWIRELDRFVAGQGRHRLATTCARRGVEHGDQHRALGDALACARLLLSLAPALPADLDELLERQRALAAEHEKRRAEWIARGKPTRQRPAEPR